MLTPVCHLSRTLAHSSPNTHSQPKQRNTSKSLADFSPRGFLTFDLWPVSCLCKEFGLQKGCQSWALPCWFMNQVFGGRRNQTQKKDYVCVKMPKSSSDEIVSCFHLGLRYWPFSLGPSPMTRFPKYAALSHICFSEIKCTKTQLSVAWRNTCAIPHHHPFSQNPHKTLNRSSGKVRVKDKE